MSDLISRQAAINAISRGEGCGNICRRALERLPSAEPKKGKWIDHTDDGYVECPFCHSATNCDGNKDELHYCFSCGADMREREEYDDKRRNNQTT